MTTPQGRIVVALNRQSADALRAVIGRGDGDVRTLIDAIAALGAAAEPLNAIIRRPEFQRVTSAVPNKTRSLRDLIALESRSATPPRRSLVGVFALNAAALPEAERQQLIRELRSLAPFVATAYEESSEATLAQDVVSLIDKQTYLNPAPEGIGLKGLSPSLPAGTGVGIAVIDKAWNLHHETLSGVNQRLDDGRVGVVTPTDVQHGTSTLAIILSAPGKPVMGIAHRAQLKALRSPSGMDDDLATNPIAEAINDAAEVLAPGDVLLIELQEHDFLPVEINIDTWHAIADATQRGIVVIEPAGNNTFDLDDVARDKDLAPAWNWPDDSDADSGAIMVSGCTTGGEHHRDRTCNQGERVDCFAPSQSVVTAGGPASAADDDVNRRYRTDFGGTSAAVAIIAGVVLRMQALAVQTPGIKRRLTPGEIRELLRSPGIGTPISFQGRTRYLPDLAKLHAALASFAAQPPAAVTAYPAVAPGVHPA